MKHGSVVAAAIVACVISGCSAGATEQDRGPNAQEVGNAEAALTVNPYLFWNCTLQYGNDRASLGYATYLPTTPLPPPTAPVDAVSFYAAVTHALGYAPQNRQADTSTLQWYRVEMTGMTSAQQAALKSVVTQWQGDDVVAPGVNTCTFDVGDCLDFGGTPATCRGTPRTILVYDPRACGGACQ